MSQFKSIRRAEVPGYLLEKYGITVAVGTLNKWATTGEGPPFAKFSRWPMYRLDQLDAWAEAILVSVQKVLESNESLVIQYCSPTGGAMDVDKDQSRSI